MSENPQITREPEHDALRARFSPAEQFRARMNAHQAQHAPAPAPRLSATRTRRDT